MKLFIKLIVFIIFTDFFFTFPSKEEGINIVPEFIEESPEQVALMSIGSDPYKRPSLSIYVYDFFENESNNNVFNWISQREMIASNYLVIGLEKDKLFSKTNQNLNFGFDSKHFLLIQFKTTKKLSEKIIQTVRKIIQEHIINDFEQCKTEIENKIRTSENAKFLDETTLKKYDKSDYIVESDIVINSTGNGTLGRVGIIKNEDIFSKKVVPDSHVTLIRIINSVEADYIFYFLKYNQKYLELQATGSTNQTELSPEIIKKILIPLPNTSEQLKIIERIEILLNKIKTAE